MKKREEYIDIAKAIGIILVVAAHIIEVAKLENINYLIKGIYSFHMPLFFFISGICLSLNKESKKTTLKEKIKKISLKLLLPYFIWSFIYMFLSNTLFKTKNLITTFTFRGLAPLWFLAALAFCEVIFFIIKNFTKKENESKTLIIICLISFLLSYILNQKIIYEFFNNSHYLVNSIYIFIGRFLYSFPILTTGYLLNEYHAFEKIKKKNFSIILGIILLSIAIYITYKTNLKVNLHLFKISSIITFMISSLLGSFSIILLSKNIKDKYHLLKKIGKNSLAIMILHYPPFLTINYSTKLASLISTNQYLIMFFSTIIVLIIIHIAIWICEKKLFITK